MNESKDELMEEWVRMRKITTKDLDSRMRELNVQMGIDTPIKRVQKKPPKRRKEPAMKRREIRTAALAGEAELNATIKAKEYAQIISNTDTENKINTCKTRVTNEEIAAEKFKGSNIEKLTEDKKINNENNMILNETIAANKTSNSENITSKMEHNTCTNIAFLLDTPYKESEKSKPVTPGIFANLDVNERTPHIRTKLDSKEMEDTNTTSYLFGSLTKSDLGDTPIISAITPGFRLNSLLNSNNTTPYSINKTEYSSGGGSSYYKPDENEDLDKHFDKQINSNNEKLKTQIELIMNEEKVEAEKTNTNDCVEINLDSSCSSSSSSTVTSFSSGTSSSKNSSPLVKSNKSTENKKELLPQTNEFPQKLKMTLRVPSKSLVKKYPKEDLEMKKARIKKKLIEDSSNKKITPKIPYLAKAVSAASKKKLACISKPKTNRTNSHKEKMTDIMRSPSPRFNALPDEMLTALELSVRKKTAIKTIKSQDLNNTVKVDKKMKLKTPQRNVCRGKSNLKSDNKTTPIKTKILISPIKRHNRSKFLKRT